MYTKRIKKYRKTFVLSWLFASFFTSVDAVAQCAMCRAVLQSEEGGVQAEAVNDGIVYLMAFPYILLVVVSFVIYRIMKNKKKIAA